MIGKIFAYHLGILQTAYIIGNYVQFDIFEFFFLSGTSSLYAHNQSCAYVISANEDKVVNVTFLEFHLEDHNDHCHDHLQIHDGRDSTAYLIGRFCGANNPPNFVSTTNKVYMWFHSDGITLNNICLLVFSAVCFLYAAIYSTVGQKI